jgi:hypothetical protein
VTVDGNVRYRPAAVRSSVYCYYESGRATFRASVGDLGVQASTTLTSVAPAGAGSVEGGAEVVAVSPVGPIEGTLVFSST